MKIQIEKLLNEAEDSLNDAEYLFKDGRLKACSNRSYYSMFYCVQALLFNFEVFTKTHKGLQNQFNLNFVKTGIFDEKYGKIFQRGFDKRQSTDYDYDYEISEKEAKEFLDSAAEFLDKIKNYLINIK